jgi:DNA-binding transcriptional LysR family regulator
MDVHLRDLRYFVAVAEELHFTRAAARLFVSQPALSKQIAQLERQVGARLLDRDRRGVSLTPAGEALLTRAREPLAGWDTAQHEVSAAAALADAVLVVGMSTGVARNIVPEAMRRFAERRPGWRVQLRQVDWTDPTAEVTTADEALEAVAGRLGVVLLAEGNAAIYTRPWRGHPPRLGARSGPPGPRVAARRPSPGGARLLEAHADPDR